ncbi:predicted protein [Pyrenophora tritici-repentis Pt-1C-BFP]|uniref:Uncharacterized protein n=1 Tax=Pyrenophora tritici-repentis (strain Pt-1C-BFP) TaxID=426418 RepID=B2VZB9_PYRTR|nr:uncharacterized protein PTRG_02759 [Pyrenophora tritici-repentis Pt-1C-BFP]EDU45282.1 predicted protein [Pyrenophora tritici-repentis Pt-1C-BFP]
MISGSSLSLPGTKYYPRVPAPIPRPAIIHRPATAPAAPKATDFFEYSFPYNFESDYQHGQDQRQEGQVVSRGCRWYIRHFLWRTIRWRR